MDTDTIAVLRDSLQDIMKYAFAVELCQLLTSQTTTDSSAPSLSFLCCKSRYIVQEQDRYFNVKYEETSSAYQNLSRI